MSNNSKRVYENGVAVTYNELVKGLEFHIPTGITIQEFREWREANRKHILAALEKMQIPNAENLLGGKKQLKTRVLQSKGGVNA